MADALLDKDGNPTVEYTKDNYDMNSQENEGTPPAPILGNVYNPTAVTASGRNINTRMRDESTAIAGGDLEGHESIDSKAGFTEGYDDVVRARIDNQSNFQRTTNMVAGGLIGAAGTALSQIGYMSSPSAMVNFVSGHDDDNFNITSRALIATGEWLEQGSDKWTPIYEHEADGLTDQLLKFSTMKGVIQSTVGFLIPSMAVTKGTGIAMKALNGSSRVIKYLEGLQTLNSVEKAVLRGARAYQSAKVVSTLYPTMSKGAKVLGATYVQSVGEATLEAVDAHDEALKELTTGILSGRVTPKDAFKYANGVGQRAWETNMVKGALNLNIMHGFMKNPVGQSLKHPLIDAIVDPLKEAPLEGIEESAQNIFKKEALLREKMSLAESGQAPTVIEELKRTKKYDESTIKPFSDRMVDYMQSSDVILDGIIGAFSGPIQKGVGNMFSGHILPGAKYRSDVKAYKAQQEDVKKHVAAISNESYLYGQASKVMQGGTAKYSTKDILGDNSIKGEVAKAKAASDLMKAAQGDPVTEELAKEQVFTSIITESIAKGTFEALVAEAEKMKGTDAFSNTLFEYAKKVEKRYNKVKNLHGHALIVSQMNKLDSFTKVQDYHKNSLSTLEAIDEADRTALEEQRIEDLKGQIAHSDILIKEAKEKIGALTSFKVQASLRAEINLDIRQKEAIKSLEKVESTERLTTLKELYPGIELTKEYVAAKNRLKQADPATNTTAPVPPAATVAPASPTTEDGNKVPSPDEAENDPGAPEPPVPVEVKGFDEITVTKKVGESAKLLGAELSQEEIDGLVEEAMNQSKEKASNPAYTQQRYEDVTNSIIENLVAAQIKKKQRESSKGREEKKEVDRVVRKYTEGLSDGQTPEEALDNVLSILAEIERLNNELDVIQSDPDATPEDKSNMQFEINKKITELSASKNSPLSLAKARFTVAAKKEATFNMTQPNSATSNTRGVPWDKIQADFTLFMEYINDIMGKEDFARDHYDIVRALFKGTRGNASKVVPDTYNQAVESIVYDAEFPDNSNSDKAAESHTVSLNSNAREVNAEEQQLSFNRSPETAIAYKSESSQISTDESGRPEIVADEVPIRNISPLEDPDAYNGGEEITFEIDTEYSGFVQIPLNDDTIYTAPWSDISEAIFNSDGTVRPDAEKRVAIITGGIPINIYDTIPIVITGTNKEKLGHMHVPSWVNETTAKPEEIEAKRARVRQNRGAVISTIISKGAAKGTIKGKVLKFEEGYYRGFVINFRDNWVNAGEGIQDNFVVGVQTRGVDITGAGINDSQILNLQGLHSKTTGLPFVLIPVGVVNGVMRYHAEIIYPTKLDDKTIMLINKILETFLTGDTTTQVHAYYAEQGYDLTDVADAQKVLSGYLTTYTERENNMDFGTFLSDRKSSSTAFVNLSTDADGNRLVRFGVKNMNVINSSSLGAGVTYSELAELFNAYMTSDEDTYIRFSANRDLLTAERKKNKIPTPATVDASNNVVSTGKTYAQTVKDNSRTKIKGEQNSKGKTIYTVQTIVDFTIDAVPSSTVSPVPPGTTGSTGGTTTSSGETKTIDEAVTEFREAVLSSDATPEDIQFRTGLSGHDSTLVHKLIIGNGEASAIEAIIQRSPGFKRAFPIQNSTEYLALSEEGQELLIDLYSRLYSFTLMDNTRRFAKEENVEDYVEFLRDVLSPSVEKLNASENSKPC